MIRVENLTKRFGDFVAVNELSFNVAPGEVLGFLGPNGAGKSTTMKMITGFLEATSGSVSIFDVDVAQSPLEAQKMMGYLPEGAPAYGEMTVAAFLNFIAEVRGFKGAEKQQRIDKVVSEVQLGSVYKKRIETLSKGFTRRVGLAQALIHDPKVLILDEPTDGLDPNQKHQVRQLIKGLAKDKIVIISTHILEEVSAVCSRALIISEGKLLLDGEPQQLESQSRYHNAIQVDLETEQAAALAKLTALAGVASVEEIESQRCFVIFPEGGKNILPSVIRLLDEHQWSVTNVHLEKGRLDDVFRNVTLSSGERVNTRLVEEKVA